MRNKNWGVRIAVFIIIITLAAAAAYLYSHRPVKQAVKPDPKNSYVPGAKDKVEATSALINVPFTSQAPLSDWVDERHQDGCEEASILMAWLWVSGKNMNKDEAEKAIEDLADFEQFTYGNFHDTDAYDTAKLMKDYYGYSKTDIKINPSIEDMKSQLRLGKIVLVPANGQKLDNPNYKAPGPLTHMLVIKGFDDSVGKFITNDPGTRLGDGFEFTYDNVYDAMVNYPTGHHESQDGRPKAMIIVSK